MRAGAIVPVTGTEAVNSPLGEGELEISHLEEAGLSAATPQRVGDTNPFRESLNCSTAEQLELQRGQRNLSLLHTL